MSWHTRCSLSNVDVPISVVCDSESDGQTENVVAIAALNDMEDCCHLTMGWDRGREQNLG